MQQYLQDFDDTSPHHDDNGPDWGLQMRAQIKDPDMLQCPDFPVGKAFIPSTPRGYAINATLRQEEPVPAGQVRFAATTVVFCEVGFYRLPGGGKGTMTGTNAPEVSPNEVAAGGAAFIGSPGALRHHGGSNYVFVDGHAKWHAPDQVWSASRGNDGQHPSFGVTGT